VGSTNPPLYIHFKAVQVTFNKGKFQGIVYRPSI